VEKLSGQNYYDYAQKHIYDVAGMESSAAFPLYRKFRPWPLLQATRIDKQFPKVHELALNCRSD
jgi:CubicO group peptidase (beta-lactamase class C family)